jgi:hypothetical protein
MLLKNVNFNVLDHNVPVENPELCSHFDFASADAFIIS